MVSSVTLLTFSISESYATENGISTLLISCSVTFTRDVLDMLPFGMTTDLLSRVISLV